MPKSARSSVIKKLPDGDSNSWRRRFVYYARHHPYHDIIGFRFRITGSLEATEKDRYEYEDDGDADLETSSLHWKTNPKKTLEIVLGGVTNPSYLAGYHRVFNTALAVKPQDSFRVMQWNILADALANGMDNFHGTSPATLRWRVRRWKIINEIHYRNPDLLCLMEVDHFKFFDKILSALGMTGLFLPKPDSPCYYVSPNNGPDGCALFFNTSKFDLVVTVMHRLRFCNVPTNQVALFTKLRMKSNGKEFWIVSSHLKARTSSPFFMEMRDGQIRDLLTTIAEFESSGGPKAPIILAADLNGCPSEPLHLGLLDAGFQSAYKPTPLFTTWTRRATDTGVVEQRAVLDYIYYTEKAFDVLRFLEVPRESQIGPERLPNDIHPSDHINLVVDMKFRE